MKTATPNPNNKAMFLQAQVSCGSLLTVTSELAETQFLTISSTKSCADMFDFLRASLKGKSKIDWDAKHH